MDIQFTGNVQTTLDSARVCSSIRRSPAHRGGCLKTLLAGWAILFEQPDRALQAFSAGRKRIGSKIPAVGRGGLCMGACRGSASAPCTATSVQVLVQVTGREAASQESALPAQC